MQASLVSPSLEKLLSWLKRCGCTGLDDLELRNCTDSDGNPIGLGCFARRPFRTGEILFSVPQECIISASDGAAGPFVPSLLLYARNNNLSHLISTELLIWAEMCRQKWESRSHFHDYLMSLSDKEPSLSSWDEEMRQGFEGTNLARSVIDPMLENVQQQARLLRDFRANTEADCDSSVPAEIWSYESLLWARGHYLSRRYPGSFALDSSGSTKLGVSGVEGEIWLDRPGALVPLLDILNHKRGGKWISFETTPRCLKVICNSDVNSVRFHEQ
jgi:hypothetical protein